LQFEFGVSRGNAGSAHLNLPKAIFTEDRKGNEAAGLSFHQISKQTLLLPLMVERQRLFATFCSKNVSQPPNGRPARAVDAEDNALNHPS
jgi:hypothetical protein